MDSNEQGAEHGEVAEIGRKTPFAAGMQTHQPRPAQGRQRAQPSLPCDRKPAFPTIALRRKPLTGVGRPREVRLSFLCLAYFPAVARHLTRSIRLQQATHRHAAKRSICIAGHAAVCSLRQTPISPPDSRVRSMMAAVVIAALTGRHKVMVKLSYWLHWNMHRRPTSITVLQ